MSICGWNPWEIDRRDVDERLDEEDLPIEEVQRNLKVLDRIHRLLGTHAPILEAIQSLEGNELLTVLDVGAGSGYLGQHLNQHLNREINYIRLEPSRQILAAGEHEEITASVMAEGQELPFRDSAFKVVTSSLLLHHLDPKRQPIFLRECLRVGGELVIHHDLVRSRLSYWFTWLGLKAITRNSIAQHDGLASILRSFTIPEWRALLNEHNLDVYRLKPTFPWRINLVASPPM